jgi:hypothetical protein
MGCTSTIQFCKGEKMCKALEKTLYLDNVNIYEAYKCIVTEIIPSQLGKPIEEGKKASAAKGNINDDFPEPFTNAKFSKRELQIVFKKLGVSDDWESALNLKTMIDKSCKNEDDLYDAVYLFLVLIAFSKVGKLQTKIDIIYKLAFSISANENIEFTTIISMLKYVVRIVTEIIVQCYTYLYPMENSDLLHELEDAYKKYSLSYVEKIFKDYKAGIKREQLNALLIANENDLFNNENIRENLYVKLTEFPKED